MEILGKTDPKWWRGIVKIPSDRFPLEGGEVNDEDTDWAGWHSDVDADRALSRWGYNIRPDDFTGIDGCPQFMEFYYIGEHRDSDTARPAPRFLHIVLQSGGQEWCNNKRRIKPERGDVVVMNPSVPHWVEYFGGRRCRTLCFSVKRIKQCLTKNTTNTASSS